MQQFQQRAQMQPGMQLIRVTGMDGAKAYQMPPNSVVPLYAALMGVLDNHMSCIKAVCPKEYDAVMSQIHALR